MRPGDSHLPRSSEAMAVIHDPKVAADQMARSESGAGLSGGWAERNRQLGYHRQCWDAVVGADAVLVLTEWQHYRELNWSDLAGKMRKPAWVFDAGAVADPAQIKAAGLALALAKERLMACTVLVTGAAGFIGAALSKCLLQRRSGYRNLLTRMIITTPASSKRGCGKSRQ